MYSKGFLTARLNAIPVNAVVSAYKPYTGVKMSQAYNNVNKIKGLKMGYTALQWHILVKDTKYSLIKIVDV